METTLTFRFTLKTADKAVRVFIGRICRWSGREINESQVERLGRSCLSIACSAPSLERSAQAESDDESYFFVRAAGVHRFTRRYHVNNVTLYKFLNYSYETYKCTK